MTSVTVRQAVPEDDLDVLSVTRAAIREDAGDAYSPAQVAAWAPGIAELDDYESALRRETYLVLVAEVDDAVVGYAVLNVAEGSLLSLYIRPGRDGAGIGSTLLGHIESSARMSGVESLDLLASRNAVGFYEANGYERRGTVDREIHGETLTFVRMETDL